MILMSLDDFDVFDDNINGILVERVISYLLHFKKLQILLKNNTIVDNS